MPLKTARITPRGFNEDQLPDGSFWSVSDNGLDRDGALSAIERDDIGYTASPVNTGIPWHGLYTREPGVATGTAARDYWFTMGTSAGGTLWWISASQGGAAKAIYGAIPTPTSPDDFTSCTLNQQPVFNLDGTSPRTWDFDFATPSAAAIIPGWFGSAHVGAMRAFRDFLIGMDVTTSGTRTEDKLVWSDRAVAGALPTVWTPAATNEAGDLTVGDGQIIDGLQLGDQFMVFCAESAHRMEEIGLPQVMGIRRASSVEGVMARNCIQNIDNVLYVVGNQDIYATDGRNAKSIIDPGLRRSFFSDSVTGMALDQAKRNLTYTAYNQQRGEFYVCYASADGAAKSWPDKALVFNGENWGIRDIGDAAASDGDGDDGYPHMFSGLWPDSGGVQYTDVRLMAIDPDATDDQYYISRVEDGTAVTPMTAEVRGLSFKGHGSALIRRVLPLCKRGSQVNISVGVSDAGPGFTPTYGSSQLWSGGEPLVFSGNNKGRFLAIKIESQAGGTLGDQQFFGFEVVYEEVGEY